MTMKRKDGGSEEDSGLEVCQIQREQEEVHEEQLQQAGGGGDLRLINSLHSFKAQQEMNQLI